MGSMIVKGVLRLLEALGLKPKVGPGPLLKAYRSAVHESTGYVPSRMFFGRDLHLPCDLLFRRPRDAPSSSKQNDQTLQAWFQEILQFPEKGLALHLRE
ncbi:hypothetical protein TNCV_3635921 [Trichonephila clavipes]|nr:hypothetical protein TNCV_3635921 [Trichonephila clavipes]